MHVGGQRRVLLPPSLGYGDAGLGSGIVVTVPPKSNLVYDLQLLSVR
jgi:FKBP-type peptidyl-prolyl cis-trans isomerase